MDITGNGAKFNVGIVIHTGSLNTDAGGGSAILLPDNYRLEWYEYESLTRSAYITSQVYNDDHPQGLVFTTTGLAYKNGNDNTCFLMYDNQSTIVNYLYVNGAVSGGNPVLGAIGAGTDIDIILTPKGAGTVRFGTRTACSDTAINGYLTIKDSGGTTRKLAIIA
jgi:hypothetical protein